MEETSDATSIIRFFLNHAQNHAFPVENYATLSFSILKNNNS